MSRPITKQMMDEEKQRMYVELELFGRLLLYPENILFWETQEHAQRKLAKRWWEFWK